MAKNKQWYVTRKPSAEYVMYDFARSAAQAKDMLRDLSEGSPLAHRSKSEGGLYNIYVKKGSVYWREKGGGVDYFTRKDGSKISKDEWYKGMEDKLGFEKFAERILKDSQFGRTTSMPKNEFKHNRNIARATIEDDFVFIDHSPKGIKENQSGEMVHTFKDLRKLTEFLQREKIYAHGGKMKQGYNDRMDDSLGNRRGKASSKEQDYKDRRDESKAMNKAEGKRAYQSVGTMDKMADGGSISKSELEDMFKDDGDSWKNDKEFFKIASDRGFDYDQDKEEFVMMETFNDSPYGDEYDEYAKGGKIIHVKNDYNHKGKFMLTFGDEIIEDNFNSLKEARTWAIKKGYLVGKDEFKKGGKTDDWIQGVEAEMEKKGTVGAFTKQAKRAGMTVKEFTKEVLDNPDKYSKRTRERAQFAKNVSKYESGGLFDSEGRKYSKKKGAFLSSEWFTGDLDFLNY